MGRQTNSVFSGAARTRQASRIFRNRLALTTILTVAPFMGYGRQAYAACDPSPSPTFICSGANGVTQTINANDANVSTVAGFSVNALGDGVNITGDGNIRFTDINASPITGTGDGLYVRSTGNYGLTPGSVTIQTNGDITGGLNGIIGLNDGSGSLAITADGTVLGQNQDGIVAVNSSDGVDLTVTTGAASSVTGFDGGIAARNNGSGNLLITANGEVTGQNAVGIYAYNSSDGNNLTVNTGVGSSITGDEVGIGANNEGGGDLSITANGSVTGQTKDGIFATNSANGDDLSVTTGALSVVYGNYNGIDAQNNGGGDLKIIANGEVTGNNDNGISAFNSSNGDNLTITTGAQSVVYGNETGIYARNESDGNLEVTADGEVTGYNEDGIRAYNSSTGNNLTIITGAQSVVTGDNYGIYAQNFGGGNLEVTANGQVTGFSNDGIYAFNGYDSGNLTVTTGAGSAITGSDDGIDARNYSNVDLTVKAYGEVTGQDGDGIYARNSYGFGGHGLNLTVITGAASVITGSSDGIDANNFGSGNLTITADGAVTGQGDNGIEAYNSEYGVNLKITTGAQSVVTSEGHDGINANNQGSGNLEITANGVVDGQGDDGIYGTNFGANTTVITGASSVVTGVDDGIDARHYGDGSFEITVNGSVTGNGGDKGSNGIEAYNDGDGNDTIIKVGAAGLVQGDYSGIDANSADGQDISITNDGLVRNLSAESDDLAINARGGAVEVDNNSALVGTVFFDTSNAYNDTLDNDGRWNTANGFNDFGGGDDELNITGTLLAADDPTDDEETTLANLEEFNNNPGGLISLVDGQEGDDLFMFGEGPDALEYTSNDGKLAVDALLGPAGESDRLSIDGDVSGATRVQVNVVDATGANLVGIPVVIVQNGGTTAEGDFVLDGPLNAGFFTWDLRLDGDTHELFTSGVGVGSFEFAAGITGAQDIWHQTTGVLLQRQADLRALIAGAQVTPVADFAQPVEPTPVAHITPGFWLKGVGAYLERDDEEDGFTLDRKQTIFGALAGFDFGTENAGEVWMFGLFGGYLTSDLDFKSTNTEWNYEGPSVGAYATYLDQAFYVDATVKADFLDISIDPEDLAPGSDDGDTDAFNIGGLIDTGYKFGFGGGVFVEPQASLAVVHTEIDDVDIFGGTVQFDDETSVRGRLGLRLGYDHTASNAVVYSSDVTASAWQEFTGENDVSITDPIFGSFGASDDAGGTYGDVSLGFSMAAPDGWSGFMRGNYQFGNDFEAFAGNAGVRYAF